MDRYELRRLFFRPRSGNYVSYIATERGMSTEYILTVYDLSHFEFQNAILTERLRFIYQNRHLFHCKTVFFDTELPSVDSIRQTNIARFLRFFYVVEPIARCLCDCGDVSAVRPLLPGLACFLKTLHAHGFVYGYLSPFTIVADNDRKLGLRVPPLLPIVPPKAGIAPPFPFERPHYRSLSEIELYLPPERELTTAWDRWSFGVLLAGMVVLGGGELFAVGKGGDIDRLGLPGYVRGFLERRPEDRLSLGDLDEEAMMEEGH
jgi:hypothetical protein